jgi:hypothetical protein
VRLSMSAIAALSCSIVCGLGARGGGGRRMHPAAPARIIASAAIAPQVGKPGFNRCGICSVVA